MRTSSPAAPAHVTPPFLAVAEFAGGDTFRARIGPVGYRIGRASDTLAHRPRVRRNTADTDDGFTEQMEDEQG